MKALVGVKRVIDYAVKVKNNTIKTKIKKYFNISIFYLSI